MSKRLGRDAVPISKPSNQALRLAVRWLPARLSIQLPPSLVTKPLQLAVRWLPARIRNQLPPSLVTKPPLLFPIHLRTRTRRRRRTAREAAPTYTASNGPPQVTVICHPPQTSGRLPQSSVTKCPLLLPMLLENLHCPFHHWATAPALKSVPTFFCRFPVETCILLHSVHSWLYLCSF